MTHAMLDGLLSGRSLCSMQHHDIMETFSALLAICEGNHRAPLDPPHKGQWRRALMFSLICAWANGWANNRDAGDLRRYRAHYDVTVIISARFPLMREVTYVTFPIWSDLGLRVLWQGKNTDPDMPRICNMNGKLESSKIIILRYIKGHRITHYGYWNREKHT